jgi:hypothetical protein
MQMIRTFPGFRLKMKTWRFESKPDGDSTRHCNPVRQAIALPWQHQYELDGCLAKANSGHPTEMERGYESKEACGNVSCLLDYDPRKFSYGLWIFRQPINPGGGATQRLGT